MTDRVEQPAIGREIVLHRLWHIAAARQTHCERRVPPSDLLRARNDLPPSPGAVSFIGSVPLPQVEYCIPSESERRPGR
jgi:hypothetical protein